MRNSADITTTATEAIPAKNWTIAHIHNNSDTTIFIQWTEEADALTSANGFPLEPGKGLTLNLTRLPYYPAHNGIHQRPPVMAIHAGEGTKELRYVLT